MALRVSVKTPAMEFSFIDILTDRQTEWKRGKERRDKRKNALYHVYTDCVAGCLLAFFPRGSHPWKLDSKSKESLIISHSSSHLLPISHPPLLPSHSLTHWEEGEPFIFSITDPLHYYYEHHHFFVHVRQASKKIDRMCESLVVLNHLFNIYLFLWWIKIQQMLLYIEILRRLLYAEKWGKNGFKATVRGSNIKIIQCKRRSIIRGSQHPIKGKAWVTILLSHQYQQSKMPNLPS